MRRSQRCEAKHVTFVFFQGTPHANQTNIISVGLFEEKDVGL